MTGIAGGEFGIRGFVDAYDAATGDLTWRAWTIPGPDHPDNQTWAGESWRTGGSASWITGAYDPDLDLVYWGTGNPGPDWNGDVRLGDNLYSDSVLALDHETGGLEWYFQFTPHDVHDWDAIQVPILADLTMGGEERKVMMWANRNAFFYTLDRVTGEFLLGEPYAKQTWAVGLDSNGRPIRVPDTAPTPEGTLVSPPVVGGTNWFSPAFSPRTELFYVQAYDGEDVYYKRDEEYVEGRPVHRRRLPAPAPGRELRERHPRDRPADRRRPVGVPGAAALDRRRAGDGRRPGLQRQRRRLVLRPRRGHRRPAVERRGGRQGSLRSDDLRRRRPPVRDHRGRQRRVHLRDAGVAAVVASPCRTAPGGAPANAESAGRAEDVRPGRERPPDKA